MFEAKGIKTKDLFARQNYEKKEQEHPVIQTVSNMQRFAPPAAYGSSKARKETDCIATCQTSLLRKKILNYVFF